MPANTAPIFPVAPSVGIATLVTPTAVTSRANITGTTNLTQLTATSTNGTRVDRIEITATGASTAAGLIFVWIYNGTTSYLVDEIAVSAITPSTTAAAFTTYVDYTTMVLPPTFQLYVSSTISQNFTVVAYGGTY